ncbi:MAG TPA: hypothetical protein VE961_13020 [Pyrinomonadaceae bacterium]|nr:hypothetical protein [Pyrinomonadaceae bacterium]
MKLTFATIIIACALGAIYGQVPTLRIQTDDPNLPSDLYYGNVKVKPLRVRPGTNPPQFITIGDSDFFVQQQYIDFLNRMPDSSGFNFWLGGITSCNGNQPCIDVARINTSGAFFLAIEFQQTGYLVERMYKAAYGDSNQSSTLGGAHSIAVPIVRLSEFLPDVKQVGNGVIVNQIGWEAKLEANKVAFTQAFVQRSRFTQQYPTSTSPANFVKAIGDFAGVPANDADRTKALNEFGSAADTSDVAARGRAIRDLAENTTVFNAEQNRAFVLMQYFGYLRRDPNGGQDTDYTGYDFWLTKLNQFNGSFVNAEMVKAFITSTEYLNRF